MTRSRATINSSLLKSLGTLAVNFSNLELTIRAFIWDLIGSDQRTGQIVTAELRFPGLIDVLSSLYRHRVSEPTKIERLNRLRKRLEAAEERRNGLIDSSWALGPDKGVRFKITAKAKRGFKFTSERMTAADIDQVADEIAVLNRDVLNFIFGTLEPEDAESA